jgi:hypothetical protein
MQFYLEAYLFDHQERLRQAMAGCKPETVLEGFLSVDYKECRQS